MGTVDLGDLMWRYAARGVADWNALTLGAQAAARSNLGPQRLAVHDWDLYQAIRTFGIAPNQLKFVPVPRVPQNSGIYPGFFLPIRRMVGGVEVAKFELLLMTSGRECMGLRFEPPHPEAASAHKYAHVQMCRELQDRTFPPPGIMMNVPNRYPAFGMPLWDPVRRFLAMATAVHGYYRGSPSLDEGIEGILTDIYKSQPLLGLQYINLLRGMFH